MGKNVLIVFAHPEPKSLNGSLKDVAVERLTANGHRVVVSDLYAMNFKATADGADFLARNNAERLNYMEESRNAYENGTQAADVAAEQTKLKDADAVIFQFPMWWFSMPAILKGWVERVFAAGLTYGVGQHGNGRWGDRYGEGKLMGRRSMLSLTCGGLPSQFGPRGVNGSLDDLLFPIQHGILYYPGMDVLPPFVVYQSRRQTLDDWPRLKSEYEKRLDGLFTDGSLPFRLQNGGHYDDQQVLKPGLGAGESGTRIHLLQPGDPPQAMPATTGKA
jgi:NAD(P)H dehydrogenase (quinone)